MMTMTSSTADDDPPRCQNNIICNVKPSKSIRELIAAKNGTRGSDSLHNHHLTFLREIPTRISPSAPTAAAVDRHAADDDVDSLGIPHQTPHLSPDKTTNDPQIISFQPVTNDYVDCTLDKIQTMMR